MKLAFELLLDQLLAQYLPGFEHQGETLGPPLLNARRHPMGACRVDDQRPSRHAGTWRAEPSQRIQEADLLHVNVLERS
jgi:hypothetical protein